MYYIYHDELDSGLVYWNRRERRFQSYLTKSCLYPTFKGASRVDSHIMVMWGLRSIGVHRVGVPH